MAQFTLDPEALAGKYEALREDVNGDRDVMHKRIATLEELNKEAHRKYAELQKKAHELQQQVVFAKAGVPTTAKGIPMMTTTKAPLQNVENVPSGENIPSLKRETLASPSSEAMQQTVHVLAETEVALQEARQEHELSTQAHQLEVDNLLDALEKKDRELREQDVRIETLLAFVPDKDVAMVFDGSDKPPTVHDLDADLDAIADGTVSPRHVGRPVIVARFPQKSTEPSSMDIRGGRGEMIEAPDEAIANAPHKPRPRAEKEWRAAAERRRKEAAAQEAPERAQESAVEETKEVVKQEPTATNVVEEARVAESMAPSWDRAADAGRDVVPGRVDAARSRRYERSPTPIAARGGRGSGRAEATTQQAPPTKQEPTRRRRRRGGAARSSRLRKIDERPSRRRTRTLCASATSSSRSFVGKLRSSRRRTRRRTNGCMRLRGTWWTPNGSRSMLGLG